MDVPNFLHSADPVYNQYTSKWIEMIKSKSILISKEGEKERKVFFKTIDKKLEKAKLEIERLIELHL